ncbi:MAG: preprotein translocase subunit YajC [Bacteroidales bacterium]|nr:preprotein translocase subunit YajC [Candidatus Equimonas faecalis]
MITLLQAGASGASNYSGLIMIALMFVVIYFFMIRPQSKQAKKIAAFRQALTVGQDVVTTGGIHGTVKSISDTTVTLRVATGVEIVFDKSAIVPAAEQK